MHILAGAKKGMRLNVPDEGTRPTTNLVKKSLFDSIHYLLEGATILDLFAGSGALGLEALSRGAKEATFVEKSPKACACIKKNIDTLHFTSIAHLFPLDVEKALVQLGTFDLIFMDPPYDLDIGSLTAKALTHLKEGGLLIVEQSKRSKFLENLTYVKKKEFGDTFLYFFDSKHPKPPCNT